MVIPCDCTAAWKNLHSHFITLRINSPTRNVSILDQYQRANYLAKNLPAILADSKAGGDEQLHVCLARMLDGKHGHYEKRADADAYIEPQFVPVPPQTHPFLHRNEILEFLDQMGLDHPLTTYVYEVAYPNARNYIG